MINQIRNTIRPGDYLDVRTCTMVTITRDGDGVVATWHDGRADQRRETAAPIIADLISRGILTPTALARKGDLSPVMTDEERALLALVPERARTLALVGLRDPDLEWRDIFRDFIRAVARWTPDERAELRRWLDAYSEERARGAGGSIVTG